MPWELTAIAAAGFAVAAVHAGLAFVGWRHRESRCGPEITALHVAVGLSVCTYAVQLGFGAVGPQRAWWRVTFALSTAVPVLWLVLVAQYVTRSAWLTRRRAALLALEPLVLAAATLTNPSHHLVWTVASDGLAGPATALQLAFGPLYYAHVAFAYLLISMGTAWILLVGIRWSLVYWKQVALLAVAPIPPFLAHLAYLLDVSPVPGVDLTSFFFPITGALLISGLYHFDLLERVPIARRRALQAMGDGLVVLDADRVVVDVDDVASRVLDPPPEVGRSIETVFPDRSFDTLHGTTVTDANNRAYDVRIAELTDDFGDEIGYALALRDVTGRHRYEQRLEVANRVLRHNLRNDMNVVRGYAELVASGSADEVEGAARSILERTDDLIAVGDKARKVSELDDPHAQATDVHDVAAVVAGATHQARQKYPDVSFPLDGSQHAAARLADAGSLATAIEELIELFVAGNGPGDERRTPDDATLRISVECDDDVVVVRLASNDLRIPAVDRDALAAGSETPLRHAEGLGLWLAYWCVTENGGELDFAEDPPEGADPTDAGSTDAERTAVTLRFPGQCE
ncbi:MAG: histidine kinase N-terminal 7TM domain-containing protein [Haloquadratum sp.]